MPRHGDFPPELERAALREHGKRVERTFARGRAEAVGNPKLINTGRGRDVQQDRTNQ